MSMDDSWHDVNDSHIEEVEGPLLPYIFYETLDESYVEMQKHQQQVEGLIIKFPSQGFLQKEVPGQDVLTLGDDKLVRRFCGFSDQVEVMYPVHYEERSDGFHPGWVCLPLYPFYMGFHFPFPHFTRDFLKVFRLSPAQLTPQTWRILYCIEYVTNRMHEGYEIADLMSCYDIEYANHGRISLVSKPGKAPLFHGTSYRIPPNWCSKYFFVRISSLGMHEDWSWLHNRWSIDGNVYFTFNAKYYSRLLLCTC